MDFITNLYLKDILDSYDAYFIVNKYGNKEQNTHHEQFSTLKELLKDDKASLVALDYLYYNYDCYYKNEFNTMDDSNPFYYLQKILNSLKDE